MAADKKKLAANLASVRQRIAQACQRARRLADEVSLVAVTKAADVQAIKDLLALGQLDMGENRVRQLTARAEELAEWQGQRPNQRPRPRWHMVGHLQRNKAKACLMAADVIHSVDSLRLAEEISVRAQQEDCVVECFLEVNCANESQKAGVAVGAATHLVEQIDTLEGISLTGLMTMAPLVEDPEQARCVFSRLRELLEEMRSERIGGNDLRHLSMGMSNDFEIAIEEGATILRIGTALFE